MEIEGTKPFAEIIESNSNNFLAQTWDSQISPNLAELVEASRNNIDILGIVTNITTACQDPMRYPFAYKKTEEELQQEQPQIFEFLKTNFVVHILGYKAENKIHYSLPAQPGKIHSFVKKCNNQTKKTFFEKTAFLSLLFSSGIANIDEILISIIKNNKNYFDKNSISKLAYNFSLLSGNDYKRLKLFLKRIEV